MQEKEEMSYQEKTTIVSIISTILIFSIYSIYIYKNYLHKPPTNPLQFGSLVLLALIPLQVTLKVVIYIAFSIFHTLKTKEEEPNFTDELEKLIELKATRNSYYLFMLGFLASLVALSFNAPPLFMFYILLFSLLASDLFSDISKIYMYRRGV